MSNGSNQHLSCSSFKNYSSGILSLPHPSIHTDKSKIIDNDQSPTKCSGSPLYLGVIPIIWKSLSCVATLSMEFSRQEYWSGWPFPSPGDLPDSGIELRSPTLPADSLPSELPRKPCSHHGPPHLPFISWYIKQSIPPAKDANIPGVENSSDI